MEPNLSSQAPKTGIVLWMMLSSMLMAATGPCGRNAGLEELKQVEYDKEYSVNSRYIKYTTRYCTHEVDALSTINKYIVVFDRSFSNQYQKNNAGQISPGTDPLGTRRFSKLREFFQNVRNSQDLNASSLFSLIKFSESKIIPGGAAKWGQSISPPINNTFYSASEADRILQSETSDPAKVFVDDGGVSNGSSYRCEPYPGEYFGCKGAYTDYEAALNLVLRTIEIDRVDSAANPEVGSNYIVIFVSDGAPIIKNLGTSTNPNYEYIKWSPTISSLVSQIVAAGQPTPLDPTRGVSKGISFNTIYYNFDALPPRPDCLNPDLDATAQEDAPCLLFRMATLGKGKYKGEANGTIDYSEFSIPAFFKRYTLANFYLINRNTTWEGDVLSRDSDGDGLSDKDELDLGFNPGIVDSGGLVGISDGVEAKLCGAPCLAGTGSGRINIAATCSSLSGYPILYSDRDNDGLNDCEELLLAGTQAGRVDPVNPDSNGDLISDGAALWRNFCFKSGEACAALDTDSDGLTNGLEFRINTPTNVKNSLVNGLTPYKYEVRDIPYNELSETEKLNQQSCYNIVVDRVAYESPDDQLELQAFETTSIQEDRLYFRRFPAESASKFIQVGGP